MSDEDLLTKIKQNLKQFDADVSDQGIQLLISDVRAKVPRLLLPTPRRGVHLEYDRFLHTHISRMLAKQAAKTGVDFQRHEVQPKEEALEQFATRVEKWRELECLTAAPHTFESLRHLPELQQLIAFTAVGVVSSVGTLSLQSVVVSDLQSIWEREQRAPASSVQDLLRAAPRSRLFGELQFLCCGSFCLLNRSSPDLLLALAAEVAAGLLCTGQPVPPDTCEHGAALKLFLKEAAKQTQQEVRRDKSAARLAHNSSSSAEAASTSKLQRLWAHAGTGRQRDEQQQAEAPSSSCRSCSAVAAADVLLPPPGKVRSWQLAPHIDLQLQLPASHLLKQVVLAAAKQAAMPMDPGSAPVSLDTQQEQEQQDPVCSQLLQLLHDSEQQEAAQRQDECGVPTQLQALVMLLDCGVLEVLSSGCQQGAKSSTVPDHDSGCSSKALCAVAATLAARCLAEHVALGQHQALPLQALQLLTAVRQLEVTAQAACAEGAAADKQDQAAARAVAAKQQLVHQALLLLQHVQDMRASMHAGASGIKPMPDAMQRTAGTPIAAAGVTPTEEGSAANCSQDVLPPSEFFASDGPLSGALVEQAQGLGTGLGLWEGASLDAAWCAQQDMTGGPCSSSSSSMGGCGAHPGGSSVQRGPSSAPPQAQQQWQHLQKGQEQQLVAQHLLQASMLSTSLQSQVADKLTGLIHQVVAGLELEQVAQCQRTMGEEALADHLDEFRLAEYVESLRMHGVPNINEETLLPYWRLHRHLAAALIQLRALLCAALGLPTYDAAAWQAMAHEGDLRLLSLDDDADSTADERQRYGNSNYDSSSSGSDDDWDMDVGEGSAACERQGDAAGWSSPSVDSSADRMRQSAGFILTTELAQLLMRCFQQQLDTTKPRTVQQQLCKQQQEAVMRGASAASDMAHAAAARMAPLQQWHDHQDQRQQQAACRAMEWWNSQQRVAAAVAGATGKAAAAEQGSGSTEHLPSSSGGSKLWVSGQHDHHPLCPLCQEERQQEQQQRHFAHACDENSSSSNSKPCASWPVAYDDPFLWRRLMWKLLGKVSPEAQAFYAKYLAMCPHCCSKKAWAMVYHSLDRCMWSPPEVNTFDCLLYGTEQARSGRARVWFKQHSRAINSAYQQGYHPSTSLLAKQVLLALSPLHHQVLPPPEVAHYLPSSFRPAIGKALMQQVFEAPVLDGFQHDSCRLHLWHVWWHVGLRRYHWMQHRQQQLQQAAGSKAGSDAGSGSGGDSTWCGMSDDHLYMDNDARLYAVGFATRQLTGHPATPASDGSLARANTRLARHTRSALHTEMMARMFDPELRLQMMQQGGEAGLLEFEEKKQLLSAHFVKPGITTYAMPVLSSAACGPDDPLVPLRQQQGAGSQPSIAQVISSEVCGQRLDAYLQLGCPNKWQQYEAQLEQEFMQDPPGQAVGSSTQQAPPSQQQPGPSDMSALMMLSPVPGECLQGPDLWWAWHQQLLGHERCDICDKQAVQQVLGCPACGCAVYCSDRCKQEDHQHHTICSKLVEAHKRYKPRVQETTSSSGTSPQLRMPQPCGQSTSCSPGGPPVLSGLPILASLLQASAHEGGPLGHAGAAGAATEWPRDFATMEQMMQCMRHGVAKIARGGFGLAM